MESIERINVPHTLGIETSPNEADIVIVSIDAYGNAGRLNLFVLKQLGYNEKDLPSSSSLNYGFSEIQANEGRKSVLFVVTVSDRRTSINLEENLYRALVEFKEQFHNKKLWIPLMGCGDGGLTIVESYLITVRTINKFISEYPSETFFNLSIPNEEDGIVLLNKIKQGNLEEQSPTKKRNDNIKGNYYLAGSFWAGDDQAQRFFENNIWENGHEEKFTELVRSVKIGDTIILKSTYAYEGASYLRIKGVGEVINNPQTGSELDVEWQIRNIEVNVEGLGKYRRAFARVMPDDLQTILSAVNDLNNPLEPERTPEETSTEINKPQNTTIKNKLQKANIDNDGAQTEKDLLGFENDIRAFSSLIALRELKPPLAIALFGKWGSGKSFFMHNLQKRIDFLSKHQGFEELVEKEDKQGENEEPFCKGVSQICFNAWSYMDANLWASLVANIFEKLDEYIKEQTKGEIEQDKVRAVLNKNLSIVNEEKNKISEERKQLLKQKDELIKRISEIEQRKIKLLEKASEKKLDEIYQEINKKFPLTNSLKEELGKYGITVEKLNEIEPDLIYQETKSWLRFGKNLLQFSKSQLWLMAVGALVLLTVLFIPSDQLKQYISFSKGIFVAFLTVVAPLFNRFYKTYHQFYKLYEPIKNYRDKFNKELEKIRAEYENDLNIVNQELQQKVDELNNKNSSLENLNQQIKEIEHDLRHSITGRALFNFISTKAKDEKYDKSLGIISTIRRDFETLSDLFRDYNIPDNLSGEDREKAETKKKESDEFKSLFNKPLDRIILYVDDLDRCPEDRVIEVLEAVNLLMAFPLFVVVVGVDPRWVKNALIKKYTLQFTGLLNNQDLMEKHGVQPIPVSDYLEKIFQIPFHLNEADESGVNGLLENIFVNQLKDDELEKQPAVRLTYKSTFEIDGIKLHPIMGSSQSGINLSFDTMSNLSASVNTEKVRFKPDDLKISKQELNDLKDLAWLVGSNPRSLKRYANMYRLVRAHENLNYNQNSQRQDFLAIMFILGISIGDYKQAAPSFYRIALENPEFNFIEIIDKIDESLFTKKIKQKDLPENLKIILGGSFNRYIPFVKRFSFDNNNQY